MISLIDSGVQILVSTDIFAAAHLSVPGVGHGNSNFQDLMDGNSELHITPEGLGMRIYLRFNLHRLKASCSSAGIPDLTDVSTDPASGTSPSSNPPISVSAAGGIPRFVVASLRLINI
jgi:hypothetical protein